MQIPYANFLDNITFHALQIAQMRIGDRHVFCPVGMLDVIVDSFTVNGEYSVFRVNGKHVADARLAVKEYARLVQEYLQTIE